MSSCPGNRRIDQDAAPASEIKSPGIPQFDSHMRTVGLLDLDGVVIKPVGYRKAFKDTLAIILNGGECMVNIPDEHILDQFESLGISNEWDMVAICLVIALDEMLPRDKKIPPEIEFDDLVQRLQRERKSYSIDYESKVKQLSPYIVVGSVPPSRALMDHLLDNPNEKILNMITEYKVFRLLLRNTSDIANTPTTHIFQNLVLGNCLFEQIYNCKAQKITDSYLKLFDVSILDKHSKEIIRRLIDQNHIDMAIYTARNSNPPREVKEFSDGYAPEAEMGMEIAGLSSLPLISTGRLVYLAERYKRNLRDFLKPSPLQALAATAAALMKDESGALEWAMGVIDTQPEKLKITYGYKPLSLPKAMLDLEIHLFEDSPNGLKSAKKAAEILRIIGASVKLHCWGIAEHPEKINALEKDGATIRKNINMALLEAFSNLI